MDLVISIAVITALAITAILVWFQVRGQRQRTPSAAASGAHFEASTCGNCAYFDLAEGQAILSLYPAFPKEDLPPCLVGSQYDETTGNLKRNENVPARCSWNEFGACAKHTELRWREDKCPDFKLKVVS